MTALLRLLLSVLSAGMSAGCAGAQDSGSRSARPSGGVAPAEPPTTAPAAARSSTPLIADNNLWSPDGGGLQDHVRLTWVARLTPDQVVDRLGGRALRRAAWQPAETWQDTPGTSDGEVVIAVAQVPGWSLIVEQIVVATSDEHLQTVSKGTRIVSYLRAVEHESRFVLVENGDIPVDFDPDVPTDRQGSRPDSLLAAMKQAGFDLSGDQSNLDPDSRATRAALALTAYITGVPTTLRSLRSATYLLAAMPDPLEGAVAPDEIRTAPG